MRLFSTQNEEPIVAMTTTLYSLLWTAMLSLFSRGRCPHRDIFPRGTLGEIAFGFCKLNWILSECSKRIRVWKFPLKSRFWINFSIISPPRRNRPTESAYWVGRTFKDISLHHLLAKPMVWAHPPPGHAGGHIPRNPRFLEIAVLIFFQKWRTWVIFLNPNYRTAKPFSYTY